MLQFISMITFRHYLNRKRNLGACLSDFLVFVFVTSFRVELKETLAAKDQSLIVSCLAVNFSKEFFIPGSVTLDDEKDPTKRS